MIDGLGCAAIATVAAGCYLLGVRPMDVRSAQASARSDRVERLTLELSETVDSVSQAKLLADRLTSAQEGRRIELDTIKSSSERMAEIATAAEGGGLSIQTMRPGTARAEGLLAVVPIVVSGSGDEWALRGFLETLHGSFRDVRVDQLEFSAQRDGRADVTFSARLLWSILPDGAVAPPEESAR